MKQQTVVRLAALLLVLTVAALRPLNPAHGQSPVVQMTNSDIQKLGVQRPEDFWPIQLSRDGLTLIAAEDLKGQAQQAAGGALSKIWVLRYNSDGSLRESKSFPLRMPQRMQNVLTPDEKGLVLVARQGASFWHLDLQTGELREFIHSGVGVTSFISEPNVLWSYEGKLYAVGFPVDENGSRGRQTIVALDPTKQDAAAVTPTGLVIADVYKHFDTPRNVRWANPELGYLGGEKGGVYKMTLWKKASGYQDLGSYRKVLSMLGMGDYLALAGIDQTGASTAIVVDGDTGTKWVAPAPPSGMQYNYPFISENGETLLLTQGRPNAGTISVLYGRKNAGYELCPLEGLQNKKTGLIRMSADGNHFVYRNADGLYYVTVPK